MQVLLLLIFIFLISPYPIRAAEIIWAPSGKALKLLRLKEYPNDPLAMATEAGRMFQDCDLCPEMIVVPPGRFRMGDLDHSGDNDEKPVHDVRTDYLFAVGKYEVTFDEWDTCVSGGGCGGYRPDDWGYGRGRRPVINVSWDDAKAYIAWLNGRTGRRYRLLSESEWEYVARGGATTRYSWGDSVGLGNANCNGCIGTLESSKTTLVGSFNPNAFGIYDMHGNVKEMVEDCWHVSYQRSPVDGSPWTSGGNCGKRVMRGGSLFDSPRDLRASDRNWRYDGRVATVGFRVAMTLLR